MVSYSAFWGGVGIPTIFVVAPPARCPTSTAARGAPASGSRGTGSSATTIFTLLLIVNLVLIVIGTFFRGPNWALVTPW